MTLCSDTVCSFIVRNVHSPKRGDSVTVETAASIPTGFCMTIKLSQYIEVAKSAMCDYVGVCVCEGLFLGVRRDGRPV